MESSSSTDVEFVEATIDPEKESASIMIDAPVVSEVTYQLDGDAPVAADASFEINDLPEGEITLTIAVPIIKVPSGFPRHS